MAEIERQRRTKAMVSDCESYAEIVIGKLVEHSRKYGGLAGNAKLGEIRLQVDVERN